MADSKILQTILGAISSIKDDISGLKDDIKRLDSKVDSLEDSLNSKIDKLEHTLTVRIDKIGLQVANLEDDAPTIEEFDKLEKRVSKLEKRPVQVV